MSVFPPSLKRAAALPRILTASVAALLLSHLRAAAVEEVWIGAGTTTDFFPKWSNNANWLDGSAPVITGFPFDDFRFRFLGANTTFASNDLASPYPLHRLILESWTSASSGLSGFLSLSGNAPSVEIAGPGSVSVNTLILSPSSGTATIGGTGAGNLSISAGGATPLIIAGQTPSVNAQLITLTSSNQPVLGGGIKLQSGNLVFGSSNAFGNGTLTVSGGSLRFDSTNSYTMTNAVSLESDLLIVGAGNAAITGVISSAVANTGLTLRTNLGTPTLTLTGASTYTGATRIDYGVSSTTAYAGAGTIRLSGAGSLLNSSLYDVRAGGTLEVISTGTATTNRLRDAAPVNLSSGRLTFTAVSGTAAQGETVGAINAAGFSIVTVTPVTSVNAKLTAASVQNVAHGTMLMRGTSLGSGVNLANTANVFATTAPTGLIGGGGTGADVSILPYAIGDASATGTGTAFLTYSATTGFRALTTAEHATQLSTALFTNNMLLTTAQTNAGARTINSLVLAAGTAPDVGSVLGAGSLTIISGAILSRSGTGVTIANSLPFGAVEPMIFTVADLSITGTISGTAGLTKSGGANLTLSGTNTFSGPITINGGSIFFDRNANLGNGANPITTNGVDAGLAYTGSADFSFTRGLNIASGFARVGGGLAGVFEIAGGITGSGGLHVVGLIRLSGTSTFTGPTYVTGGLALASDAALGSGGELALTNSTVTLAGSWATNRVIRILVDSRLDTAGFDATWNGLVIGAGSLEKRGAGTLTLGAANPFTGSINVVGGAVRLVPGGFVLSSAWGVSAGSTLEVDASTGVGNFLPDNAAISLTGGQFRLSGSPAADLSEQIARVSISPGSTPSSIVLANPNPATRLVRLQAGQLSFSGGTLLVQGPGLGAPGGGARLTFDALPAAGGVLLPNVYASAQADGSALSFAVYDAATDARGAFGLRPLRADEMTAVSEIRNPANGGATPVNAHALIGIGTTAQGAQNSLRSLTAENGATLTLDPGESIAIETGRVMVRPGPLTAVFTGGEIVTAQIATFGDLDLGTKWSGPGVLTKSGSGALILRSAPVAPGGIVVSEGTLRIGAADALAGSTVELSGPGSLDLAGADATLGGLSGTGVLRLGAQKLILGARPAANPFSGDVIGSGTLQIDGGPDARHWLTGGASFTGTILLKSGLLEFTSAGAAFKNATVIPAGGELFTAATGSVAASFLLDSDLRANGPGALTIAAPAAITGPRGIVLRGQGNLVLATRATYLGETATTFGQAPLPSNSAGSIVLSGASGAIANSSAIRVAPGTTLRLDNTVAFTGPGDGRLGDAIPIFMHNGTLEFLGNASVPTTETIGNVTGGGLSTISLTGSTGGITVSAAALAREDRGTFLFRSTGLGSTAKILFTTAPTLVGGGGTGSKTSIIPFAVGDSSTIGVGVGTGLVTHDANGVRLLTASEFTTIDLATAQDNVQLATTNALAAAKTVNALQLTGSAVLTGSGVLTVGSGMVFWNANSPVDSFTAGLNFGNVEGNIYTVASLPVVGVLSGTNGLTKSGPGTLTLSGTNTFTGTLTINRGDIGFTSMANLGASTSAVRIHSDVTSSGLNYLGTGDLTFTRDIETIDGFSALRSQRTGAQFIIPGTISGAGGLGITGAGTVVLRGANTYTGPTVMQGGLAILSDAALGNGGPLELKYTTAGLKLLGPWVSDRRVFVNSTGGGVDTNGFNARLNGVLDGVPPGSTTLGTFFKSGAGTLALTNSNIFHGTANVNGGTLAISESGRLPVTSVSVFSGAALSFDNATTALSGRLAANAGITLAAGASLNLIGNSTTAVSENIGALVAQQGAIVSLSAPGSASTMLTAASFAGNQVLFRGNQLGAISRIVFKTAPTLIGGMIPGALADDSATGAGSSFAIYDTATDGLGTIGVRPLRPAEYTQGVELRNPANGGTTPTTANFFANGTTPVIGPENIVNSLTTAGDVSLSMSAGQVLTVSVGGVLAQGGATSIQGGTIRPGGSGNLFITTAGTLEFSSEVAATQWSKSGAGLLRFVPARPFAGSVQLLAGSIETGSGAALAAAAVTMRSGTTLTLGGSTALRSLAGAGSVQFPPAGRLEIGFFNFTGAISGGTLRIGTGSVSVPLAHTGATEFISPFQNGAWSFFQNATAFNTSALRVSAGTLTLSNTAQITSRLAQVPVTLIGGSLNLSGGSTLPVSETLGSLTGRGYSAVTIDGGSSAAGAAQWSFGALSRDDRGTFNFSDITFGNPFRLGTGASTIQFPPALTSALVGAGTTATNKGILPFAISSSANGFVTFDPATGIRPLAASEYSTTATPGDNVQFGNGVTVSGNIMVNSLTTAGFAYGTGTITVSSGAVLTTSSVGAFDPNLAFGTTEANVFTKVNRTFTGTISGMNGLTKSGGGELSLTGALNLSGPLTINSGSVSLSGTAQLPASVSEVVLGDGGIAVTGSSLSRPIRLNGTLGWISGTNLTVTGPISGSGGLEIRGTVSLPTANSYSGVTSVSGGLILGSDASLGTGSKLYLSNGAIQLTAPWITSREISLSDSPRILAGAFDAQLNGALFDSGNLEIVGTGVTTIANAALATGYLTMTGGTLRVDKSARPTDDMLGDNQSLILNAAAVEFTGHPSVATDERIYNLSNSGGPSRLRIIAPGTAPFILRMNEFISSISVLNISAPSLGGNSGAFSRIVIDGRPPGNGAFYSSILIFDEQGRPSGFGAYDTSTDQFGTVGLRAARLEEMEGGSTIRNPANGGTTSPTGVFAVSGPVTTEGSANTVAALYLAQGAALQLDPVETLTLSTGIIFIPAGVTSASISGGTLGPAPTGFRFFATGDATFTSTLKDNPSTYITKSGLGTVTLATPNLRFNSTVSVEDGTMRIGTDEVLNQTAVTVQPGGRIEAGTANSKIFTLAGTGTAAIPAGRQLTILAASNFAGRVTGEGTLRIGTNSITTNPVTFSGTSDLTGPVLVDASILSLAVGGKFSATSGTTVRAGGTLQLQHADAPIPQHAPLFLDSGILEIQPSSALNLQAGPLVVRAVGTIAANSATQSVQLTFDGIDLSDRSGLLFVRTFGGALGGTPGAGVANIRINGITSANLVGAGTGAQDTPILPFAFGSTSLAAGIPKLDVVTYDGTNGLRALSPGEYASTLIEGANVRLGNSLNQSGPASVNSLIVERNNALSGPSPLRVASGLILIGDQASVGSEIDFGDVQGRIYSLGYVGVGTISGRNGLLLTGNSFSSIPLALADAFAGPVIVSRTTARIFNGPSLGQGASPLILNDASLSFGTSSASTLTHPIELHSGRSLLASPGPGALTISSSISGPGALTLQGFITLTGANSYTGETAINGDVTFNGDAAFGGSPSLTVMAGTLKPIAPWSTARTIAITGPSVNVDTGAQEVVWSGPLTSGDGGSGSPALKKIGTGRLILENAAGFAAPLNVAAGEVILRGGLSGTVSVALGSTFSGSGAVTGLTTVSGKLAPGEGTGTMQTGGVSFASGSTFELQIDSATLSDRLKVIGSVTLGGPVKLSLSLAPGYDPVDFVDRFTLIDNDGTDAVSLGTTGRFTIGGSTINEGGTFIVGTQFFSLTYAGGDGNDVVLTPTPEPGTFIAALLGAGTLLSVRRSRLRGSRTSAWV